MEHLMVDIETWGCSSNAAIASIGAVCFNPDTGELGDEFYRIVSIQSCLNAGLEVDEKTVYWWMNQGDKYRLELVCNERTSLDVALREFRRFMSRYGSSDSIGGHGYIWAYSPSFDLVILKNAYKAINEPCFINYRYEVDLRTLVLALDYYDFVRNFIHVDTYTTHNALDDAKKQAEIACSIWSKIKNADIFKLNDSGATLGAFTGVNNSRTKQEDENG